MVFIVFFAVYIEPIVKLSCAAVLGLSFHWSELSFTVSWSVHAIGLAAPSFSTMDSFAFTEDSINKNPLEMGLYWHLSSSLLELSIHWAVGHSGCPSWGFCGIHLLPFLFFIEILRRLVIG